MFCLIRYKGLIATRGICASQTHLLTHFIKNHTVCFSDSEQKEKENLEEEKEDNVKDSSVKLLSESDKTSVKLLDSGNSKGAHENYFAAALSKSKEENE